MSRHPEVKWAQRLDRVYVTVQLPDSKIAKVDLTPDRVFTFSANAGAQDHFYELKLELFGKVNVEKAEKEWWKRLLKAEGKPPHYVKVDWDKWVDENEDEGFGGGDLDLGGMDFSKFGGMGDDFEDSDDEGQEVSKPEKQETKNVGGASVVGEQDGGKSNSEEVAPST